MRALLLRCDIFQHAAALSFASFARDLAQKLVTRRVAKVSRLVRVYLRYGARAQVFGVTSILRRGPGAVALVLVWFWFGDQPANTNTLTHVREVVCCGDGDGGGVGGGVDDGAFGSVD